MKEVTYNGTTYYEANVVPGYEITKFKINNAIEGTLTTTVTTVAAKLHEIAVTVNKPEPIEYNLSDNPNITINDDKEYILTGSGTGVTIKGNATVTLKDVTIKPSSNAAAIHITSDHTATLILEGTNTLTSGSNYSAIFPQQYSDLI